MNVLFFFPPTGTSGEEYASDTENKLLFKENTLRIYLRGCQHPSIGNGLLYPDLDIAANHIYNAFEDKKLNLDKLKANLGDGIYQMCSSQSVIEEVVTGSITTYVMVQKHDEIGALVEIESIGLNGHSRGAISTFAVAKKLDELNIPIDIIADQPVPGVIQETSDLIQKYSNLSQCRQIRSASVFLATHSNYNAWWHNIFFKQLLPKFSSHTITNHFLLPIHEHFAQRDAGDIIRFHTNHIFSMHGYTKIDEDRIKYVKKYYSEGDIQYWWRSSFIPLIERQPILGNNNQISPDPIYLKLQLDRATDFLSRESIIPSRPLEPDQAAAIDYLFKTYSQPNMELAILLLENTPKGRKFCHIINTITETCRYVATLNLNIHRDFKKADAIKEASLIYQQTVFKLSYDFLNHDKPTKEQQAHFKSTIYGAEQQFRKDALGIEMGYGRLIMKFLTNFILHITGIGMIANAIHKTQTGNWLFFNHNRSTNIIKNMRETLFNNEFSSTQAQDLDTFANAPTINKPRISI